MKFDNFLKRKKEIEEALRIYYKDRKNRPQVKHLKRMAFTMALREKLTGEDLSCIDKVLGKPAEKKKPKLKFVE